MNIADLFVSIAVKGSDATRETLQSISKGMNDLSSGSLLVKAGILGAVYAAEQFMTTAAASGTELRNYEVLTGKSAVAMQKWGEVARLSGGDAEDMKNSMISAQKAMVNMRWGGGPPGMLGIIADYTGKLEEDKLDDPNYVMERLRKIALHTKLGDGDKNHILAQFLSDKSIVALKTFKGELSSINKNFILSEGEYQHLHKVNIAWSTLWKTLDMYKSHINAKYGMTAISTFTNSLKFLTQTTESVINLAKAFPLLSKAGVAAGIAIAFAFAPISTSILALMGVTSEFQKYKDGKESIFGKLAKEDPKDFLGSERIKKDDSLGTKFRKFFGLTWHGLGYPDPVPSPSPKAHTTHTTVNNHNVNITGNGDPQDIYDAYHSAAKKAHKQTVRQIPSQKGEH